MEFRRRRGNYTVLFVLTSSVMLSYLAFSIDGGRMQVARLDGENAAEAAALAAMASLRDGGDETDAALAAGVAANKVTFQNTGKGTGAKTNGGNFTVNIDWGRWNWEAARTTLDSRWDRGQDGTVPQAITVNVRSVGNGIGTIFGAAIGFVTNSQTDESNFSHMNIGVGVRAAFRSRDIVLVVDASRFSEPAIVGVQQGMQQFVDALADNGVPGDNVALIGYAGEAWTYDLRNPGMYQGGDPNQNTSPFNPIEATSPFASVRRDRETMRETLGRFEPCNVGQDAFFHAYRFMLDGEDLEVPGAVNWNYWAVEDVNGRDGFQWVYDSQNATQEWLRNEYYSDRPGLFTEANWGRELSNSDQCAVWNFVETALFTLLDPRRERIRNGANGMRSPIECHAGNPLGTAPDTQRYRVDRAIPSADCADHGNLETGEVRYRSPVGAPNMYRDQSYFAAGSNPGVGLRRAKQILDARTSNGEPTVVLISSTFPRCGPNLTSAVLPECDNLFASDTAQALAALDADKVITHVVSVSPAGSQTDVQLGGMTTGRGRYNGVSTAAQVGVALDDVVKDLRVQVVR